MRYSVMRKVLFWFLGVLCFLVGGAVGAYYLAKAYEEPVRNYIVKEVNKRLESPVHVSDINFSLLERFPSASLVMDSVWAEENILKMGKADTLFFFEKVYLNLNILDVINGQYKINEIETRDGFLRLFVDEQGYDNYHIWVSTKDTTGFLLELDQVHIERTECSYINLSREQSFQLRADDLRFNGKFSDDSYVMDVSGDGFVHDLWIKGTNYLHDRAVDVSTDLDVINAEDRYGFRKGELTIDNRLSFSVSGSLIGDGVDLRVVSKDLDIIEALELIPQESRAVFQEYSSSGELNFDCTLKGAFSKTESPRLKGSFSFSNASIERQGSGWKLTRLTGSGTIDNGAQRSVESTTLNLDQLEGALNGNAFSTQFSLANLKQPRLKGNLKMKTDIAALSDLLQAEWIEAGEGQIEIDASIDTELLHPEDAQARDFLNASASGAIQINDAVIKLKDDHRIYSIQQAAFTIDDNALEILGYNGAINQVGIALNGRADGFLNYFFSDAGVLKVRGEVKTGRINLDELFPSTSESQSGIVVAFPSRAEWDLAIESEAFQQGKFIAEEVSGRLVMNHFKVEATNLSFKSQQGMVSGKAGVYRFANNQYGLLTNFETEGVDIKQLFSTFNNFDQDFITHDVLEGSLTSSIRFQAFCDSLLNIDVRSVVASMNLTIKDGALIGFGPLIEVADEVKAKPMLRLFIAVDDLKKRLENVRFATLSNEISIRDGVINVPQMEIRSSVMNLNVSGSHSFEHEIDYAMDFALSEVLELKNRTEPFNEFVQRDSEGKTRIFLTMKGTADDFEVELERTNLSSTLLEKARNEKETVKQLLKQEFNALAKDSIRREPTQTKELQIEFDPEAGTEKPADTPAGSDESKAEEGKDGKLLNRLFQKTETDKKKLREGDFEDDDF